MFLLEMLNGIIRKIRSHSIIWWDETVCNLGPLWEGWLISRPDVDVDVSQIDNSLPFARGNPNLVVAQYGPYSACR